MFLGEMLNVSGLSLLLVVNLLPLSSWQSTVNPNDSSQAQKALGYIGISRRLDSDDLISSRHSNSTDNDAGDTSIYADAETNGTGASASPGRHEDGETDDGARSRGQCDRPDTFANLPGLTFLAPDSPTVGTTVRDFPTFLVYTPFDLTNDSPGHFVLENLDGDEIYSVTIHDQLGNSIRAIPLPSSIENVLEAGQTYQVNFYVYCGDSNMSNSTSLVTEAQVERVAPNAPGVHWYDSVSSAYQQGVTSSQFRSLLESQNDLHDIPEALTTGE